MPFIIFNKHANPDTSWCDEVVNVMRPNILGNPFPIGRMRSREKAIAQFEQWLFNIWEAETPEAEQFPVRIELDRLAKLNKEGKTIALVCCCAPLPCHAEVIAELCSK